MTDELKFPSVVIDKDGNPWGPFSNAIEAAAWAKRKWPDQEQDDTNGRERFGAPSYGWDIWALRAPD